jgi:NAD(P)-dependent dehydrogenase (short-subunit alcohol dehydrogenase family)
MTMPKRILILGSGPGLSAALARRFGGEGWQVILVARNAERLDASAEALRGETIDVVTAALDVSDFARLDAFVRAEAERDGGIDVLVYNAATIRQSTLLDQPLETFASDLLVGVGGAAVAARAAIPAMASRGSGSLLFTGGGLGTDPWPQFAILGACKAALRNLAHALSKDPACASLYVANISIAELITPAVAERIADYYWRLHHDDIPGRGWDMDASEGVEQVGTST